MGLVIVAVVCGMAQAAPMRSQGEAVIPLATTNGRSMDVEVADLNGDGRDDLVIATEFGQNAVLLHDGTRFVHAVDAITQGPRHDSEDIAIADLNGDGRPDIV
ncbi:MAG: VCBS repeat-containing protein, partial [Planctomycetota bacterium]